MTRILNKKSNSKCCNHKHRKQRVYRCGVCDVVTNNDINEGNFSQNFAGDTIEVVGIYTAGASIFKASGQDRFSFDVDRARALWNININILNITNGSGTDTEGVIVDPFFPSLTCDNNFRNDSAVRAFLRNITIDGGAPTNRIHVIYVGETAFANGNTAGCAWTGIPVGNRNYNVILMTNGGNNGANDSLFAHELGHILYGTVPNSTNADPTTILDNRGARAHSYRLTNVMQPTPGNRTELLSDQIAKAQRSNLFV